MRHRNSEEPISSYALYWIYLVQITVCLPHMLRLPLWLTMTCVVCVVYRWLVQQNKLKLPGKLLKFIFIVIGIAFILSSYGSIVLMEPGVALLVLTFVLKLLELKSKRDAYIVITLGFIVIIAQFLFSQSIAIAFMMTVSVILLTGSLIALNQTTIINKPVRTIRLSLVLLLQSFPLMVVLFLLFPRIPPLWSAGLINDKAVVGFGDSISPGDIADLSQSDEIAFRVEFESAIPEIEKLYWRGLVFSHFDGRSWRIARLPSLSEDEKLTLFRSGAADLRPWEKMMTNTSNLQTYTVTLQPTQQRWLFSLTMPILMPNDINFAWNYRIYKREKITKLYQYTVTSYLDYQTGIQLSPWQYDMETRLPLDGNPRAKKLAKELRDKVNSDADYVRLVLSFFKQNDFTYTLHPPLLGENTVDEFLFKTKKGFCEHFASSFVFMMRAADVPARVIGGYMGGEINPLGNYVVVRQFDAHAWTEVMIKGRGWIQFDPTALVSPDRIESGLEEALKDEGSFLESQLFSLNQYRDSAILSQLRMTMDVINHQWNQWVINYDQKVQSNLVKEWFGNVSSREMALIMLFICVSMVTFFSIFILKKVAINPKNEVVNIYLKFCKKLEKKGLPRFRGESPNQYARRVNQKWPENKGATDAFTADFVALMYVNVNDKQQRKNKMNQLKQRLKQYRFMK